MSNTALSNEAITENKVSSFQAVIEFTFQWRKQTKHKRGNRQISDSGEYCNDDRARP